MNVPFHQEGGVYTGIFPSQRQDVGLPPDIHNNHHLVSVIQPMMYTAIYGYMYMYKLYVPYIQ